MQDRNCESARYPWTHVTPRRLSETFDKFLRTMDEHAGGSMADGELAGMSWYVEDTKSYGINKLSPVDQQKALSLQYEEALRNKVQ